MESAINAVRMLFAGIRAAAIVSGSASSIPCRQGGTHSCTGAADESASGIGPQRPGRIGSHAWPAIHVSSGTASTR